MDPDLMLQGFYIVLILAIIWVSLRFVLNLARKVFAFGCSLIIAIAVLYLIWQWLGSV
jgi:hypothetical protein